MNSPEVSTTGELMDVDVPLANASWRRCAVTGIYTYPYCVDWLDFHLLAETCQQFSSYWFLFSAEEHSTYQGEPKVNATSFDLLLRCVYVNLVDQSRGNATSRSTDSTSRRMIGSQNSNIPTCQNFKPLEFALVVQLLARHRKRSPNLPNYDREEFDLFLDVLS